MRQRQQRRNVFVGVSMATVLVTASIYHVSPAQSDVAKPPAYATIDHPVTLDYSLPVISAVKSDKQEVTKSDDSSKKTESGKNENRTIDITKNGRERDKPGAEKQTLNLTEAKGKKNLVLFFLSEQCGVTFFYKSRLQQIQKDFAGKGFVFVGIRGGKRQNPDEPLELAETTYLMMPFVDDTNGALIRYFRVRQSLTFAVIDREGRLCYRGGFDDSVDAAHVKKSYLRSALRDIAAGKPVAIKEGDAIGCAIVAGP